MVFRNRENGIRFWRKNVRELIGEEWKILSYYNFVMDGEEIDSDLFVLNLFFGFVFIFVICVFVFCYYNLCKGEFVFDDFEVIVVNKDLMFDILFGELFYYDFWGVNISFNISYKSYCFFIILIFWFNYWFVEGLYFWGFYVVNVIFYVVVLVLCLKFFLIIFNGKNNVKFYCDNNFFVRIYFIVLRVSLVGVIFFVVYFIYIECVSMNIYFIL